jgi:hypothetical protein
MSSMAKPLRPTDVFTPNRFPLEENNVYAARADAERNLMQALDRNQIPVIYGEYGVGKTTLVKKFFARDEYEGRFVHLLSPAGKNLDDVAKVVLEALRYSVDISSEQRTGSTIEASAEAGVFGTLKAKLRGDITESRTTRRELVVRAPTDQGLLDVMADARVILAMDEMHKASDGFRLQLAEMLKATANLGRGYPKVVVLGTTADASDLVRQDEGIDRLVREVRVEPMTDTEATFVVTDGMAKLGLKVSDERVERIVRTAAGAPALLQEICLDVAERAVDGGASAITDELINESIRTFLLNSQARLTQRYMSAIETFGPKRYRKQVLRAMAESPNDFVTMEELTTSISIYLAETVPATALSGPLQVLKQEDYGEILRDVERPSADGSRVYNLNAFKDPRMKAFIRAMHAVEEQGLLPKAADMPALPPVSDDD